MLNTISMDARRISFYVTLLPIPHSDHGQVGSPSEVGQRVEVPVVVLIVHRTRTHDADEVAGEQRGHHVLRRQLHRSLAEPEPVEGADEEIARLGSEGVRLDHAPDAAHGSVGESSRTLLRPAREDEEQQQTQLQTQQRATELRTHEHLREERERKIPRRGGT